jgi:hypothetical protein
MAYGAEIENDTGKTLITGETTSYQVLAKGVIGSVADVGNYRFDIPNTFPDDLLCFLRPHNPDKTGKVRVSGSYISHYRPNPTLAERRTIIGFGENEDGTTCQAEYLVVQKTSNFNASTSGYGLEIYHDTGDVNFSSEIETFRVRAERTTQLTSTVSGAGMWYQGTIYGEISNLWTLASHSNRWRYHKFENTPTTSPPTFTEQDYTSYQVYDYPNNKYGIEVVLDEDTNAGSGNLMELNWIMPLTEIIGFAI